jgi:hypothetical protein
MVLPGKSVSEVDEGNDCEIQESAQNLALALGEQKTV